MSLIIRYPHINPELFSISVFGMDFALRWYALAYIAALILGWLIVVRLMTRPSLWPNNTAPMTRQQVEELLTAVILGVVLGGRLGYVLFYRPAYYLQNPLEIPILWNGGMAFHGGFLGVVIAVVWFCRRHDLRLMSVADALALATPTGLLFGRLANFINGELWGRPAEVPWAMVFPDPRAQVCPPEWVGACARHPSQLYEAGLEGIVLGLVLVALVFGARILKRPGMATGVFFAGSGISRFIVEYFRQADAQFITPENPMGHILSLGPVGVTMGQILSLPMIVIGVAVILYARRKAVA
jgi:phosphatidylglycerol---prolipoprotein diacylglyceryl transferase